MFGRYYKFYNPDNDTVNDYNKFTGINDIKFENYHPELLQKQIDFKDDINKDNSNKYEYNFYKDNSLDKDSDTSKLNILDIIPEYENFSIEKKNIANKILNLDKDDKYKKYLLKMAMKESSFDPSVINKLGYKGLFQFGDMALKDIGMTEDEYMSSVDNQLKAMDMLMNKNRKYLKNYIDSQVFDEYSLLGAAHLGGAKGVRNFIEKGKDSKDAFGTSISKYFNYFKS